MLNKEQQTKIFEVVNALNDIYNFGFFSPLNKSTRIFSNYEFAICAIIRDTIQTEKTIEIPIDFIDGAEGFSIQSKQNEQITAAFEEITVAKINRNGFTLFPEDLNKLGEGLLLKEKYFDRFVKQVFLEILTESNDGLSQQEKEEMYVHAKENLSKNAEKNKKQNVDTTNFIELEPSKFYFLNELIADLFCGGIWGENIERDWENTLIFMEDDLENLTPYDYWPEELFILSNTNIGLYVDAILFYDGNQIKERIISLEPPFYSKINYKLRGFHDGIYCPISKSEYIAGLSYSIPVKETLTKIVDYIETLPFPEVKTSCAKEIIKKFEKKGFIKKEENEEQKQIKEAILLLPELFLK